MTSPDVSNTKIGWIGAGRMGFAMASRLLKAGCDVAVYNRTRARAEPLAELGATIVDSPAELAHCDIVFTMVAGPDDFINVTLGESGLFSGNRSPRILIDSTSVSEEASAKVRSAAEQRGVGFLAAPVSGNAKVVKAGKLSLVVSGPRKTFDEALPFLEMLGTGASYVTYK